jgi:hypothetical protein
LIWKNLFNKFLESRLSGFGLLCLQD